MASPRGNFVSIVTTAGVAIAIAFVGSAIVFANSSYHTMQREGSWAVLSVSSWLEVSWAVVASILALARWRTVTVFFRIVFAVNLAIAGFLLVDLFWFRN